MADDFDALMREWNALGCRIFEAGQRRYHERVASILQLALSDKEFVAVVHSAHQSTSRAAHGSVVQPVVGALRELSSANPAGSGAADVAAYFVHRGGGPDIRQIRGALKLLHTTGKVTRIDRGRYLPAEDAKAHPSGGTPDADTSGYSSLAAE